MKPADIQMTLVYRELELLYSALDEKYNRLRATGDFPEEKEYLKLREKVVSAKFKAFDKI